jgi:uncharacterized protein YjeT (DUF2065 family)
MTLNNIYFMQYIDSIIPFIFGVLLILFPNLFTKSTGLAFEKAKQKFKMIGFVLIGVALLYLLIKKISV